MSFLTFYALYNYLKNNQENFQEVINEIDF